MGPFGSKLDHNRAPLSPPEAPNGAKRHPKEANNWNYLRLVLHQSWFEVVERARAWLQRCCDPGQVLPHLMPARARSVVGRVDMPEPRVRWDVAREIDARGAPVLHWLVTVLVLAVFRIALAGEPVC